jgi:hypothetical protein
MPVYIFINSAIVATIIFKVEEDIVIGFKVVANVAIIVALGLIVSVKVAIIVVIIICYLPRVYILVSLFSLAERVFASFAL